MTLLIVADRAYGCSPEDVVRESDARLLAAITERVEHHDDDELQDLPNRHVARKTDVAHEAVARAIRPELAKKRRSDREFTETVDAVVTHLLDNRLRPDREKVEKKISLVTDGTTVESPLFVARTIAHEASEGRFRSAEHLKKVTKWLSGGRQSSLRSAFYMDDWVVRSRKLALTYVLRALQISRDPEGLADELIGLSKLPTPAFVVVHGEQPGALAKTLQTVSELRDEVRLVPAADATPERLKGALADGVDTVLIGGWPINPDDLLAVANAATVKVISVSTQMLNDPMAAEAERFAREHQWRWVGLQLAELGAAEADGCDQDTEKLVFEIAREAGLV